MANLNLYALGYKVIILRGNYNKIENTVQREHQKVNFHIAKYHAYIFNKLKFHSPNYFYI